MKLRFTKMQGAGNDFVVLDGTRAPLALTPGQVQRLGDRRFGVGADQILLIERSSTPGVDFRYRIYNNTGDEVERAPVELEGPQIESHERFPRKVNAGFMQIVDRTHIKLRVYERDAGETLACGTGACAAVVAGIRLGWLDQKVDVEARGGRLTIEWAGGNAPVFMTGP